MLEAKKIQQIREAKTMDFKEKIPTQKTVPLKGNEKEFG